MLVSYQWLQSYFDESLPAPERLGELLTMRVLELDGMEQKGEDTVLDLKVLADRGHYCLSHRGVVGEITAITGLVRNTKETPANRVVGDVAQPEVSIESEHCSRYMARRIESVSVGRSPEWLISRIAAIGQKSINNIVDAANFVMFDMGQPLHAFDADKVRGGIVVRNARDGERLTTLDGKEVALDSSVLVIADGHGPLAIAGVKGGTRAEVDAQTQNIILESAHFHAGATRTASAGLGTRTDASKRFENDITPEYAPVAMEEVTALILAQSPAAKAGPITDAYPHPVAQTVFSVNLSDINARLGVEVPRAEAIAILKRLNIGVAENGDMLTLTIPYERLDLVIPEDIVEEIGRLYGYEKVPNELPPTGVVPTIDKGNYYREKIRDILAGLGFSEVYLYTLTFGGHYEIELPLSEDKKYLRTELSTGLGNALARNVRNASLLGLTQVKLFEFGNVFPKEGEALHLALGAEDASGHKDVNAVDEVERALEELHRFFGKPILHEGMDTKVPMIEFSLDNYISTLPEPPQEQPRYEINRAVQFQKFSPYPFITRDIALWVPSGTSAEGVEQVLRTEAGELLARLTLFDQYQKDGRTSYAFRLVFQSPERTLTNEEVSILMERISAAVQGHGWEVR